MVLVQDGRAVTLFQTLIFDSYWCTWAASEQLKPLKVSPPPKLIAFKSKKGWKKDSFGWCSSKNSFPTINNI